MEYLCIKASSKFSTNIAKLRTVGISVESDLYVKGSKEDFEMSMHSYTVVDK